MSERLPKIDNNHTRHQKNLRVLTGWYYGVWYKDGHPRAGEFPPKAIGKLRRLLSVTEPIKIK